MDGVFRKNRLFQIAVLRDILFIFASEKWWKKLDFFIVDTKDPGVYFGEDIPKQGLKRFYQRSVTFDTLNYQRIVY